MNKPTPISMSFKKVSFDFDDTLDRENVQEYAKELVARGLEVWIVTSRHDDQEDDWATDWNDDLYIVADEVGIPKERIQFMSMADKYKFFEDKDFVWHLDDHWLELNMINNKTSTFGISVCGTNTWKNKCNKLLKL